MSKYPIVDLINGLERYDGYTPEYYKSFTPTMISKIEITYIMEDVYW